MRPASAVACLAIAQSCACSALSGLDDFDVVEGSTGGAVQGGGGEAAGGEAAGGASEGGLGGIGGMSSGGTGGSGGADPCGNGVIDSGEECDDANAAAGDGCDSCTVECPGVKEPTDFHCYVYESVTATWDAAEAACAGKGAGWHLAAMSSQAENDFLTSNNLLPQQVWLGARDPNNDNQFVWTNGEPWGYAPWITGNPDAGIQCLTYNPFAGGFVDRSCNESWRRLCELTPAGTP